MARKIKFPNDKQKQRKKTQPNNKMKNYFLKKKEHTKGKHTHTQRHSNAPQSAPSNGIRSRKQSRSQPNEEEKRKRLGKDRATKQRGKKTTKNCRFRIRTA